MADDCGWAVFSPGNKHNAPASRMCRKDDFSSGMAWKFTSFETSLQINGLRLAAHNKDFFLFFLFSSSPKRNAGALVFSRSQKKGGKDERPKKKGKLYFTSRLKGSLASQIHNCSIFWGSKAVFEAGRYVLIIWRLNDDTEFIINGPHPSTLPLTHSGPVREFVLALAAFLLFDLFVITSLFFQITLRALC